MESIKCHWCRQGAPETQGVILGKSKIKIYKHDNGVERPGNTMSTILLDVISESIQICDSSFCVDSLNHMYFRAVWGLSTDSFPAWKQLVNKNKGDAEREIHVGECCWRFAAQTLNFKPTGSFKIRQNIIELSKSHMVQYCVRVEKTLVWDYDRYVREAFDIGEDGTGKHRNCAIDFIRLWVLFMFLLIPYFRMLDDIGKTSSLFSRPCSTALWSPRLFLFPTDFSHSSDMTRWVAVTARTHDWTWSTIHRWLIKFLMYHISM